MSVATLNDIRKYFAITSATKFAAEWKALTDADKDQIREGIADGSLTY